jgi:hypothetical protein
MEELLSGLIGRSVDVVCSGGANIRGQVMKVASGVLHLNDNEQLCFIAIDKISLFWEAADDAHRAGFVSTPSNIR